MRQYLVPLQQFIERHTLFQSLQEYIIQIPEGKSVTTHKWIYMIKHTTDENVNKYKTRSIARCFLINKGSCLWWDTWPSEPDTLPSVLPSMSWKLYQIDRFLLRLDFSKSITDLNLYRYSVGDESLILMNFSESVVTSNSWLLMKNLSMTHHFLGKEVWQRTDENTQWKY